jgi:hypothetical protein
MIRPLLALLGCLFCLASAPIGVPAAVEPQQSIPGRDTPKKLTEVWLRFHEQDLCQGIDADFTFRENGMVVRGFFEDSRLYQRFEAMLNPLRSSYAIELHLKRCQEVKDPDEGKEKNPPASLWENLELRSYLGDSIARARVRIDFNDDLPLEIPPPNEMLKQRLLIYADKVLEWDRKMERYAKHLPDLTRMAHDSALPSGLRGRAGTVVIAHVRKMDRLISKLQSNLERAFPRPEKSDRTSPSGRSALEAKDIVDYACQVSEYAQTVSKQVHQFLYPERYTVSLDELRRPSLLASLKSLREMSTDFQKAVARAK